MKDELLEAINKMAEFLNTVSRWYTSGSPFGHIESKTRTDYIYEFYCYIRFIEELSENNSIRINIKGAQGNKFPKAPSIKSGGWAKFEVCDEKGDPLKDICAGVEIEHSTVTNYTFAPDISIQECVDYPTDKDVFLFVDAKFKEEDDCFSKDEIELFGARVKNFNLPKDIPGINLNNTTFNSNTLVTNAGISDLHQALSREVNVKQVGKFQPNSMNPEFVDL